MKVRREEQLFSCRNVWNCPHAFPHERGRGCDADLCRRNRGWIRQSECVEAPERPKKRASRILTQLEQNYVRFHREMRRTKKARKA